MFSSLCRLYNCSKVVHVRDTHRLLPLALGLWLLATCSVEAQRSATLNQYRAPESPGDGLHLSRPAPRGHLSVATQLHLDLSNDPLVYENAPGLTDSEVVALVSEQLTANLAASLGLYDVALVYLGAPINLLMEGATVGPQPTATGFGFGDLYLGARLVLYEGRGGAASFQTTVYFPTGEGGDGRPGVAGEDGASFQPEVLGEVVAGPVDVLINVGIRFRPEVEFAGVRFTDVLTFGFGAEMPLLPDTLSGHLEVWGESALDNFGVRESTPLEALLGAKLQIDPHMTAGLGAGAGLLRGYGSPDYRIVAMFGWASTGQSIEEPKPDPLTERRRSEDAEWSDADDRGAPRAPEGDLAVDATMADSDGDLVADLDDRCPQVPGEAATGGCARFVRYDREAGSLALSRPIEFESRSLTPKTRSLPVLDEIAATLRVNRNMRVRIEAHMAPGRRRARPKQLATSSERAHAVGLMLIEREVRGKQLEVYGCGSNRPIVQSRGTANRKNERIEVHVVRPLPAQGARSTLGCMEKALAGAEAVPRPAAKPKPAPKPMPAPKPAPAPGPAPAPAPSAGPPPTLPVAAGAGTTTAMAAALASAPSADHDKDGRANARDKCPLAPGLPAAEGCPASHRVDLDGGSIELTKPIRFESGSDKLKKRSLKYFDELAATLKANPSMKLAITAHVADEGDAAATSALTAKRANAARKALEKRGVAPARLKSYGCGSNRPVAPNNVPWGRKRNERIDLLLLDPAPPAGVHSLEGCTDSK
ncbi:MAG: OmpA family protein [Myxococcales bacterium]|nr:OmpA family protein [Myxococcales bacterium]